MRKIWVIYSRPTDFPAAAFVMREHILDRGAVRPTEHFWMGESIEELHDKLPKGAIRMPRSEDDEPQIVEWYF